MSKIKDLEWETFNSETCHKPKCWCRGIRAKTTKETFVDTSFLTKWQADLIVRIHNEWLKLRQS